MCSTLQIDMHTAEGAPRIPNLEETLRSVTTTTDNEWRANLHHYSPLFASCLFGVPRIKKNIKYSVCASLDHVELRTFSGEPGGGGRVAEN